ncbi:hypothetical protein K456DRAFT_1720016 [Colletotrichum gloeosporioides 23]|nr:hypothetical protein K456DRAFT_1720016 [Colletotrichum gloeosporioides 23]
MHSKYNLRSRLELYTYRQILNQVRYWSTFLSLPMKRLRKIHKVLNDEDPEERDDMFHIVMIGISVVPQMLWMFTRNPTDKKTLKAVRQRDGGVCCITGKIKTECCYIFPFWTSTRNRIWPMMHLICTFLGPGYKVLASRMQKLVDTPQNMLHLSSQLHKYWDEGVFGLEPLNYVSWPQEHPSV